MNQPDAKVAEQLWLRAHEAIRRGNLPQAVRDLAKSFEILKVLNDPRVRQVHAKWVATHKLYLEEKQAGPPAASQQASTDYKTLQAQAESAANQGDLEKAIALYERVVAGQPENELAKERIAELRQAKGRAAELGGRPVAAQPVAAQPVAAQPVAAQPVAAQPVAPRPVAAQPVVAAAPAAVAAPASAVAHPTKPIGPALAPGPGSDPASQAAFLKGLLTQVQARRRPHA